MRLADWLKPLPHVLAPAQPHAGHSLAFEYGGRTVQIGKTMYEPKAAEVLAMIAERLGIDLKAQSADDQRE
jgi:hypothetical protein